LCPFPRPPRWERGSQSAFAVHFIIKLQHYRRSLCLATVLRFDTGSPLPPLSRTWVPF